MDGNKDKHKETRSKVQAYLTPYEMSLIDAKRELTGETKGAYVRRILRLFLKGQLVPKENKKL